MNICFISYRYPSSQAPSDYVFVKNLVDAIAARGHHCYVLSPFNISHHRGTAPKKEEYMIGQGKVTVLRPGYISMRRLHIGKFYISEWLQEKALRKAYRMMGIKPDIIYGHFWYSAYKGYRFAKEENIPLFVATGESDVATMFRIPSDVVSFREHLKGAICVSSKNRDESIQLGLITDDKCEVFPNAIDNSLFRKLDKEECRIKIGIPASIFVVAFVGWFCERKGSSRIAQAISRIQGEPVYTLFVGRRSKASDQEPQCEGILFKGPVPHDNVPLYLCAADCFVLPTLQEGCCNAVIEAMACGLPVISSNLPFNWDVLDETNSIMVNPNSTEEIAEAIRTLRDDKAKRDFLSKGALKKAESLTIGKRAEAILHFIDEKRKA